jgi:hypothetical protein
MVRRVLQKFGYSPNLQAEAICAGVAP